jgi:phosphopantothenoylcysteine decarboxylase/phosphopantothenate--cysteine ligase
MNLEGKICVITAGPTYEAIDPVRFIGNRSSGRMGIELAEFVGHRGAHVILVLGPSSIKINNSEHIRVIRVETAEQMYQAVSEYSETMDIGIFAAAVSDYRPAAIAGQKIKKSGDTMTIELIKNKDILAEVGKRKKPNQILVGFALETNDEIEHAKSKLERKNLDMIVMNSLRDEGAGFQHLTNKVTILDRNNNIQKFELKTKREVARDIVQYIEDKF